MKPRLQQRRSWIIAIILLVMAIVLFMYGDLRREADRWKSADTMQMSEFQPGTVRLVAGLWVARQPNGQVYVFLNRDPHLGHPTEWVASRNQFVSPAHGETYRIDGHCVAGPCGVGALYRVASRVEGERLQILPHEIVSGGLAGSDDSPWLARVKRFFGIATARPQATP